MTGPVLPDIAGLRRFACRITGTSRSGDIYTMTTLEIMMTTSAHRDPRTSIRDELYRIFVALWLSTGPIRNGGAKFRPPMAVYGDEQHDNDNHDTWHTLAEMAVLLSCNDEFDMNSIAYILGFRASEATLHPTPSAPPLALREWHFRLAGHPSAYHLQ